MPVYWRCSSNCCLWQSTASRIVSVNKYTKYIIRLTHKTGNHRTYQSKSRLSKTNADLSLPTFFIFPPQEYIHQYPIHTRYSSSTIKYQVTNLAHFFFCLTLPMSEPSVPAEPTSRSVLPFLLLLLPRLFRGRCCWCSCCCRR